MTDKQNKILKYSLVAITCMNTIMCINLYNNIGKLQYNVSQLESNTMSAIQSLSNDLYNFKTSEVKGFHQYQEEFE